MAGRNFSSNFLHRHSYSISVFDFLFENWFSVVSALNLYWGFSIYLIIFLKIILFFSFY